MRAPTRLPHRNDEDNDMTPDKQTTTDDAATPKTDAEREKLLKDADQNRVDSDDGEDEVVPDPANDWPAA